MSKLKTGTTIGGSTAWHAGNHGTGSGLDADTLDGQEGTYYLNDGDFTSNGFMKRTAAGVYTVDTNTYLTAETSHADVLVDGDFASAGFMKTDGSGNYSVDSNSYLTAETSHADVLVDGDFTSNGFMKRTAAGVYSVDTASYLSLAGGIVTGDTTIKAILTVGDSANESPPVPGDLRIYDTGNNALQILGDGANSFLFDLLGTSSVGLITLKDFRLTVNNSLGVGTAASSTDGEIRATDNITAYYSSDRRLKENIEPIENAVEKVKAISGVRFDWTEDYIKERGGEDEYFLRKKDVGVIAQEIQEVLPEVVAKREDTTLAVRYEKIVPLLIQAIKEQQEEIDKLKEILNES